MIKKTLTKADDYFLATYGGQATACVSKNGVCYAIDDACGLIPVAYGEQFVTLFDGGILVRKGQRLTTIN